MGFFADLKEDLNQAVNELFSEEKEGMEAPEKEQMPVEEIGSQDLGEVEELEDIRDFEEAMADLQQTMDSLQLSMAGLARAEAEKEPEIREQIPEVMVIPCAPAAFEAQAGTSISAASVGDEAQAGTPTSAASVGEEAQTGTPTSAAPVGDEAQSGATMLDSSAEEEAKITIQTSAISGYDEGTQNLGDAPELPTEEPIAIEEITTFQQELSSAREFDLQMEEAKEPVPGVLSISLAEEPEPESEQETSDAADLEESLRATFGASKGEETVEDYMKQEAVRTGAEIIDRSWVLDLKNLEPSEETAIITAGMRVKGDILSNGSMDVFGEVQGNIQVVGKLNITGKVVGHSKAEEVFADGAKITGDILSDGTVKVGSASVVMGNIQATSAVIAGAVKGTIDVKGPVILDATAVVLGNIRAKSMQINNGARIEGMCVLCYAEQSAAKFFENQEDM